MSTRETNDDRIALLQGTLDLLILRTLLLGPCHGQGVAAESILRQSEEAFLVDHGSLYVALRRLVRTLVKLDPRQVGRERKQPQGAFLLADAEGPRATN